MGLLWREKCRKTAGFLACLHIEVRSDFGWLAEREGFKLNVRSASSPDDVSLRYWDEQAHRLGL
jgi:hypothetical protein